MADSDQKDGTNKDKSGDDQPDYACVIKAREQATKLIQNARSSPHTYVPVDILFTCVTVYVIYAIWIATFGQVSWTFTLLMTVFVGGRIGFATYKHRSGDDEVSPLFYVVIVFIGVALVAIAIFLSNPDVTEGKGKYSFDLKIKTGNYKGQQMAGSGLVCMRLYGECISNAEDEIAATEQNTDMSDIFTYSGRLFLPGFQKKLRVTTNFTKIDQLEVWMERTSNDPKLFWFVENIVCTYVRDGKEVKHTVFPFHRWVTTKHQIVQAADSLLPQNDQNAQRRHDGLLIDRQKFYFMNKVGGVSIMTSLSSTSEAFSTSYFFNVILKKGVLNKIKEFLIPLFGPSCWKSLRDTTKVYNRFMLKYRAPKSVEKYKKVFDGIAGGEFDQYVLDKMFGAQRLTGTNPAVIERVRDADLIIHDIMRVRSTSNRSLNDLLKPHIENMTIHDAVASKRLYKVDYTDILHDLPTKTGTIASPIALFFVDKSQNLMPVAIQLFKKHHGNVKGLDNPVFFPSDDRYTWWLAKMWFNNADASYHQSASHLGFTHLIMETVYLALRQTVSLSHPLYRLMAPHFLYLLNINVQASELLLTPGEWVDTSMAIGVKGMVEIIRRKFEGSDTIRAWRLNTEGDIENDIKFRGVEDLPKYTFRDDAIDVFKTIKTYVTETVDIAYRGPDGTDELLDDYEMQAWAKMLHTDIDDGGCGIKGLPFSKRDVSPKQEDGRQVYFSSKDEVISVITSVIYICSASHAAVNFRQYEQYGYPLNYPALLYGDPPRSKKEKMTEDDILNALPDIKQTLGTMTITDILSGNEANKLGWFETQYQFTDDGKTPGNVKRFQKDLKKLATKIQTRNAKFEDDGNPDAAYDVLDPDSIPNSISI